MLIPRASLKMRRFVTRRQYKFAQEPPACYSYSMKMYAELTRKTCSRCKRLKKLESFQKTSITETVLAPNVKIA